jgi:hypothetical protein
MSDYKSMNDYHLLTHDQLMRENERQRDLIAKLETDKIDLTKRHIELEDSLIELRKYHKEVEGYAARVYDPNKSTYKELEDKLALAENSKQAEIDELYETKIAPLQNQVKDREIKMESMYKQQVSYMEEIGSLKNKIEKLGMLINYAVGYISSCEQFRDKYPNDIKNWLFEGLK